MRKTRNLILIAFALFFCSCIVAVYDYTGSGDYLPVDEFHRNMPFDPGGTLSLDNTNGYIEIQGWERNEVEVYAERTISRPGRAKFYVFPRKDLVPRIDIDRFEDFIKIETKRRSESREGSRVDYYIHVPHSINLEDIIAERGDIRILDLYGEVYIDVMDGDVTAENFSGSLSASVGKGSVNAVLYDLREQDEIILNTRQGDIEVYLEKNVQAELEVSAPLGKVRNGFERDRVLSEKMSRIKIGEGGVFLSLTAQNGDIRINQIKSQ